MIFTVFGYFMACFAICWLMLIRKRKEDIPAPSTIMFFFRLVTSKFGLRSHLESPDEVYFLRVYRGLKTVGLLNAVPMFNVIKSFQLLNKKYGDIFRYLSYVSVASPEYMEVLFTNPHLQSRPRLNGFYFALGKPNLLSASPERAKILKKLYLRYFINFKHVPNFKIAANVLINQFRQNEGRRWIHAADFVKVAAASAVIRNALGDEMEEYPKLRQIVLDLEHIFAISIIRDISPFHRNDFLFNNFLGGRKLIEVKATMNEIISNIIERTRKEMTELEKEGKEGPNNFICGLLRESHTDEAININSELKTLLVTALDTTAMSVSFGLVLLGMHPEIQEKVFDEDRRIQNEIASLGRETEDSDLRKYEYTLRVIKEILRLYPAVPIIMRMATADVKMGKFLIPKGTMVFGSNLSVHRDAKMIDDPLKFDPDRFLPENFTKQQKYSFIPFGGGARSCPGSRYSPSAATYFLTAIVRNFKISSKYQNIDELDSNIASYITLSNGMHNFPIFLESRN